MSAPKSDRVKRLVAAARQWRDTDETDDVAMYLASYALQEALLEFDEPVTTLR